ncbi:MAG TPA: hypothetical protein VGF48_26490 [Thermoanaerobaculia bacterium]
MAMETSPKAANATAGAWVTCKTLATGPIEGGTTYVYLKGGGVDGWFWTNKIAGAVLEASLVALQQKYDVQVELTSTTANSEILRFHPWNS